MMCGEISANHLGNIFCQEPSMEAPATQSTPRRRSQRIVVRIPLLINARDASATTEWEQVGTVVISLHGGLIRTRQQFPVGATLDIRMRQRDRSTLARVVWTALDAEKKLFELGFEILGPPGFWEINFLPDRGEYVRRRGGQSA
jgi:hypothetical protein